MVGFADFTPDIRYPGETYVHYVSTRPDQTGKGVATHIANHLVEHAKAAGHNVDWGLIDNPTMDSVRKKVEMAHPDVAFHHKQGFR
jgi:GNAT superfamily N-acetyltransferase